VLVVVTYSRGARQTLRNICAAHDDCVVGQFGRVALLEATEFAAFQALRLREKHGTAVQVEWTQPFNEYELVREGVRDAAVAYEARDHPATPYERFAAGRDLPAPDEMRSREL
jgi:hypothetical protein